MDDNYKLAVKHMILYAKGHYYESRYWMDDLQTIAAKCGRPHEPKDILTGLSIIVSSLLILKGQSEIDSSSSGLEFVKFMQFMFNNTGEIKKLYAPIQLDDGQEFNEKLTRMLQEQLVHGLLVQLAQIPMPEEIEDQVPSENVLPVREDRKPKKKG